MANIRYFGTPIPPKEDMFRKLMIFVEYEDTPDLFYTAIDPEGGGFRKGRVTRRQFWERYIVGTTVWRVHTPIPIDDRQWLYVSPSGRLYLADRNDHLLHRKAVGRFDSLLKQFIQERM